jgi:RNA polymerase sigma factor (sigma-70 family)
MGDGPQDDHVPHPSQSEATVSTSNDPMRTYLEQIGRHPLLSAEEERRVARLAHVGDPAARRRLVESNLRLVVAIARRHARAGVEPLDLIQEGNIGLMEAADRFDPARGVRFATYAGWWIRSSMRRAVVAGSGPIRLPDRVLDAITRVRAAERELEQRLRRTPTLAEVAAESGLTETAVQTARRAARPPVELDAPLSGDGDATLADVLEDHSVADPAERLAGDDELAALAAALDELDERPRTVVALRYGLGDTEPATLGDVAGRLRLSRERVRQVETRALRNLAGDAALRAGALAAA